MQFLPGVASTSIMRWPPIGDVSLQLIGHVGNLSLDVMIFSCKPFYGFPLLQHHFLQLLHKVFQI